MKCIFTVLTLLLLNFSFTSIFATAQIPDRLIYKGDTLSIFANPLEQYYTGNLPRPKFFGNKEGCTTTACWRGYQAEWTIINNQLYLTGIFSCCFYEDNIKADLKELFGSKFINGKVKADWFTEKIIAPQGKLLYYIHMGYSSIYEKELEFNFIKGQLIGTKVYDNSKSKQSVYSKNENKLNAFIYSNIKWSTLPGVTDKTIRIFVQFSANENGIIDSIKVIKSYNNLFDKEAIRVIKAIPEWDVFYLHGRFERKPWVLPLVFNKTNKEKYNK